MVAFIQKVNRGREKNKKNKGDKGEMGPKQPRKIIKSCNWLYGCKRC